MNQDTPAVSPLRQRMIEDMRMRELSNTKVLARPELGRFTASTLAAVD